MIYIIIALIIIIAVLYTAVSICFHKYKKAVSSLEAEHTQLLQLQEEYSKLAEAYKIKKENKEKADAKVSNLHNGTTTADDILPKRKSRA